MPEHDFNILLGAQLDTTEKTVKEINKQVEYLSSKISKLDLKINIDENLLKNLTDEFEKFNKKIDLQFDTGDTSKGLKNIKSDLDEIRKNYKYINGERQKEYVKTTKITDENYKQTKIKEQINASTGKKVKLEEEVTINLKKQRQEEAKRTKEEKRIDNAHKEELAKKKAYDEEKKRLNIIENIGKETEKLIASSERFNGRITSTTTTHKSIEGSLRKEYELVTEIVNSEGERIRITETLNGTKVKILNNEEKRAKEEEKRLDTLHKEALAENKLFDQEQARLRNTIGYFDKLKSKTVEAEDVAKLLSKQYGNLEVRGYSLNEETGQYVVTLRQSGKENLILKGAIDKVTGALIIQNKTVQQAKNLQLGFFEQFKIALQRVPIWIGATTLYFQAFRFGQQLVKDIAEINKSMITLERVSNATREELDRFQKISPSMASDLGVLNQELQETTGEIVRLGYSLEEAQKLTELSLTMKNVGDLESAGQSTNYLIAIMKAFKVEVEEATEIVDFLNHTANTTSVNMRDLGEGVTRMASAMSVANNTMEETMGLLVASTDITRSAEKSSTGIRTISMRLRGLSEDGEEVAGLVPKLEASFKSMGLTLKKDEHTFKSTYEIFQDLAEVFSKENDFDQAKILEKIAGKKQADIAAGLIKNFQEAKNVVNEASNAIGSASLEQDKYMQSVEAHYKTLVNSLTELNQTLLKSGTIIKVLDFGSAFVQNASAVGKLNVVMLVGVGILGLWLKYKRSLITETIKLETLAKSGGFRKLGSDIVRATGNLLGLKKVTEGTTMSIAAMNIAMSGLLIAIPLLVQGVGAYIRSQKESREEAEKFVKAFGGILQTHNDNIRNMTKLSKEYEELNEKLGKNRDFTELTADEQERYNEIVKELDRMNPGIIAGYDDKGRALVAYGQNIDDLIEKEQKLIEIERQRLIAQGSTLIEESQKQIKKKEQDKKYRR